MLSEQAVMDEGNILPLSELIHRPCVSYRFTIPSTTTIASNATIGSIDSSGSSSGVNLTKYHCLMMLDLDYPSRAHQHRRCYLQWMVVDVSASTRDITQGREVWMIVMMMMMVMMMMVLIIM